MGWNIPDVEVEGDVSALKRKFAELLLKHPGEPLHCAVILFPDKDTQYQMAISSAWNEDAQVSLYKKEIVVKKGEGTFLPTKDKLAAEIWEVAKKESSQKLAALKLYAEVMGFVSKPGTAVSVSVTNRVMKVVESKSDEDWERKASTQQAALVSHADTRH